MVRTRCLSVEDIQYEPRFKKSNPCQIYEEMSSRHWESETRKEMLEVWAPQWYLDAVDHVKVGSNHLVGVSGW